MQIIARTALAPQIALITLNVADLERACSFYCCALGFERLSTVKSPGHIAGILRLGGRTIELVQHDRPGRAYPLPRSANDPWFQHFAVRVCDMAAAYDQLTGHGHEPISEGGPQLLPPSTGSVTAYKFRDPDGHPLEVSYDPAADNAPADGVGPFVCVDHSALSARDLDVSAAFYVEVLGLTPTARLLNQGPAQDRLDGLANVQLDIAVLKAAAGPHIELLHYRSPEPSALPIALSSSDIADTCLTMVVADLRGLTHRLEERRLSWRGVADDILTRDPDGHALRLTAHSADAHTPSPRTIGTFSR
jgi:catechol 2,3-dioxygenase-like lactoylglutathione lyase family enzyme